jgi:hypothetical protein
VDDIDMGKEFARAAVAAVVAFIAGLILKAMGFGKWVVAGGSGAAGGLVAVAAVV